ncbi:protein-L-isoaspartate(D-aspartate) O-methyltransferase [Lutimonas zeaxanthinifaciens]|uniref:protein-L-isoaspartate(D-aspartate) O-methyltransferase n=1 Tax=Lutimonas zeaxanthinifaciens TaxID=3060215 RepID=UPI00265D558F|nr:protein-L-isoaspartate(D-aspartate) O-methyltransferase [Lutimonas sp. YSD2104]WKK67545.1 protein-L-isoaspartate(D-aspartate) O-methyltransferase [Lutimonas sp. YSD2104]
MNRLYLGIFLFLPLFLASQNDYLESRERMIADGIKSRGVKDKATLRALLEVPRHLFVPQEIRSQAYRDGPLPIGFGQTISQPYIVAFMTEAIRPESNFKVLEIGTGSGYQAAILSRIVDSVYTIEIIDELHLRSNKQLKELGYNNVLTKSADGYYGWEDKGPFDAIVVTAAAEFVPPPLIAQLKEGGRMIIPVGTPFATQQLLMVTKKGGKTKSRNLMFVRFVPFTRKSE